LLNGHDPLLQFKKSMGRTPDVLGGAGHCGLPAQGRGREQPNGHLGGRLEKTAELPMRENRRL
jgi:hypothetical protein